MTADLMEQLNRFVLIDKEMITYKRLCQKLKISCRKSKEILSQFVEKESSKVDTLYVISGKNDKGVHQFKMVRDSELDGGKALFKDVKSTHVYSVGPKPAGVEVSTTDLKERTYETDLIFYRNLEAGHPWSAIQPPEVVISATPIPSRNFSAPRPGSMFKRSDPAASGTSTRGNKRSAPTPSAKPPSKKQKTGIQGFFGKSSSSTTPAEPAQSGAPKAKKGLMGFFSKKKAASKPSNPFNKVKNPTSFKKKKPVFGSSKKKQAPSKTHTGSSVPSKPTFGSKSKPGKKKQSASLKKIAQPVASPEVKKQELKSPEHLKQKEPAKKKKAAKSKQMEFDEEDSDSEVEDQGLQDAEDEEEYMLKEKKRQGNRKKKKSSDDKKKAKGSEKKAEGAEPGGGGKKVKKTRHFVDPDSGMMVTEDIWVDGE